MAIQPNIALMYQPPRFESPFNMLAQISQIQQAQQANALNQMRMQQLEREMAREESLSNALRSGQPLTLAQALGGGTLGLNAFKAQQEQLKAQEERQLGQRRVAAEAFLGTKPELGDFAETFRVLKEQGVDVGPRGAELMLMPPEQRAREMQRFIATTPGMGEVLAQRGKTEAETKRALSAAAASEAQQRKLGMEMRGDLPQPMPAAIREAEWYRTATPEQRAAYADAKASGRPVTNIINQQESALNKKLGDVKGTVVEKGFNAAQDARGIIDTIDVGRQILNAGATTGFGANFLVNVGQALKQVGVDLNSDASANAQTYMANMAQNVGRVIEQFGAGTGLSNADRDYAEKMAGGNITLDERALRRILDINERMSRNVIKKHNENVKRFNAGDEFMISEPPVSSATIDARSQQALDWARANPNDPRSEQIIRLIQGRQ